MRTLYLDYNATTPIAPAVQEAMLPFLAEHFGDPSSRHALGRAAAEAVEDARGRVARLLGADRDEIVFTSGATESNHLALWGMALRHGPGAAGHLVVSAIEHASVLEPARFLESLGWGLSIVGCDAQGVVDPAAIAAAIQPDTILVSVMHGNGQVGSIQPIRQIAEVCRRRGVPLHTDAAQSAGKIPTPVRELGVGLLSLAGHKMYAPKGIGALYVRRGLALEPTFRGEGQERGLRAGTQGVPQIVGLGQAATLTAASMDAAAARLALLRDRLAERLREGIGQDLVIHAEAAPRLPGTLAVHFPRVEAERLLARLPELCAAAGAEGQGPERLWPTLAAMGHTPRSAGGTIRLSLGWYTDEDEIDRAASLLLAAWESLAGRDKPG